MVVKDGLELSGRGFTDKNLSLQIFQHYSLPKLLAGALEHKTEPFPRQAKPAGVKACMQSLQLGAAGYVARAGSVKHISFTNRVSVFLGQPVDSTPSPVVVYRPY